MGLAGNDCYAKREFENAIIYYSRAIALHPSDPRLYSNRSAAFMGLGRTAAALRDAQVIVSCWCLFASNLKTLGS